MTIEKVSVYDLHKRLAFLKKINYPESSSEKPLSQWKMEIDDAPILRYLFRNFQPKRHLEFGTWEGFGTVLCLEESGATVWTINLLGGEAKADGSWAYGRKFENTESIPQGAEKLEVKIDEKTTDMYYHTDAYGFIGHLYREKNLGNRVCQIFCDSKDWDISNFPAGFFDSIFIDGGHQKDIVISDTKKALKLLRPGGLIIWHDYCPDEKVNIEGLSTISVMEAINECGKLLQKELSDLFWINPSWILIGRKRLEPVKPFWSKVFGNSGK
ncbi:MAG: class I SAM-dependent methyltransferase [Bacteroidetes bacterium]|nr:class I SAM-dependent methyltransferase [Bacteroidota bacterium]